MLSESGDEGWKENVASNHSCEPAALQHGESCLRSAENSKLRTAQPQEIEPWRMNFVTATPQHSAPRCARVPQAVLARGTSVRGRSGCCCPSQAAAAGTGLTLSGRRLRRFALGRWMPAAPRFAGPPATGELCKKHRCRDLKGRQQEKRVLCCIVEIVLESARLHGPGPRELSQVSMRPLQCVPEAYLGSASVPRCMVTPATAAKDIAWFSSVALAALLPLLPSTLGPGTRACQTFLPICPGPSVRGTDHRRGEEG